VAALAVRLCTLRRTYARPLAGGDGGEEDSAREHELLLAREEEILQALELPYRVVDVAAGDLGGSAACKFDCEAWIPVALRAYRDTDLIKPARWSSPLSRGYRVVMLG
jgi:hypothetical protein